MRISYAQIRHVVESSGGYTSFLRVGQLCTMYKECMYVWSRGVEDALCVRKVITKLLFWM